MCNFIKKSLSLEMVNFTNAFNQFSTVKLSTFTQSAFIQSRNKIKPEVFKHLNSTIIDEFYTDNDLSIKLWKGYRLLAVDGSRINLPDTKELTKKFGSAKNQTKTSTVQARCSVLYDVLNNFVIDSKLTPLVTGESTLAKEHILKAKTGDLIIYDRGYPSFELIYEHKELEIDFLFRVKVSFSNVVKFFVESNKTSQIIEIKPGQNRSFEDKKYNKDKTYKVRLVRVKLNDGSIEVLMTSLLNSKTFKSNTFKELYFKRWGVETYYDELKNKLKVEHFSGYSVNTIQQDFYVAIFVSNIQTLIVNDLEEEINEQNKGRKLKYKVNTNLSYGFLKDRIIALFQANEDVENELKTLFKKHLIPIRPLRNNKRNYGKYRTRTKPKTFTNQKDTI